MDKNSALQHLNRRLDRPGDAFMDIIARQGFVVAMGVTSALDARLALMAKADIEAAGGICSYSAIYAGGWSFACSRGYPDMGFLDRRIMADHMANVVQAAYPLPVVGDAETGYGDFKAITLTVRAYAEAGLAVAHLEDQDEDRACGHAAGRMIVSVATMLAKLRSWRLASIALDTSMRLLARTDAVGAANGGLAEAIERGKRYMDVEIDGHRCADLLWAEFPTPDPEVIAAWVHAMRQHDRSMPLAINASPNKDWPAWYRQNRPGEQPPSYEQLHELGYGYIFHTITTARMIMEAVYSGVREFGTHGAQALYDMQDRQRGEPCGRPQAIAGMPEWQHYGSYVGGAEAVARLTGSEGFGDGSGKFK